MAVYVDDIMVAHDDSHGIIAQKKYLSTHFHLKDLGHLRYFLGIEVDRSPQGLFDANIKPRV